MGGAEAHLAIMTVGKTHELGAVIVQAPALLPQLRRLQHGHENLLGPGSVHLLAHDVLDFLQHAEAQGQKRVQARGRLAQHAGAQKQARAVNVGVGGVLLQSGGVQGAHTQNLGHRFSNSSIRAGTISDSLYFADDFTMGENDTRAGAASHPDIGIGGFARGRSPHTP